MSLAPRPRHVRNRARRPSWLGVPIVAIAATTLALAACGDASVGTGSLSRGASGGGQGTGAGTPVTTGTPPGGSNASSNSSTPTTNQGQPGDGSQPAAAPAGTLAVAVDDAAPMVDLRSSVDVNVTITQMNVSGAVTLSVQGLPSDVTATFDNASVAVSGDTGGAAKLTLTTLSSTVSGAVPFTVVATAGSVTNSAPAMLTVNSRLTLTIPVNVDQMQGTSSNPRMDAYGDYPINITAPTTFPVTIIFHNADSSPHQIHASQPDEGFPHGDNAINPGQDEDSPRNVTQSGTYDWYLHDEGNATTIGRIVIQ